MPDNKDNNTDTVLKKIWDNQSALKQNLLKTEKVKELHQKLTTLLDDELEPGSIPYLRFQKKQEMDPVTWWSNTEGYPSSSPWSKFEEYIEIWEEHEASQAIKNKLRTDDLFVESRHRGEDLHLIIGKRDGSDEKAHVIIDSETAEIRVKPGEQEPTDLLPKIKAKLELPSGDEIITTREFIQMNESKPEKFVLSDIQSIVIEILKDSDNKNINILRTTGGTTAFVGNTELPRQEDDFDGQKLFAHIEQLETEGILHEYKRSSHGDPIYKLTKKGFDLMENTGN